MLIRRIIRWLAAWWAGIFAGKKEGQEKVFHQVEQNKNKVTGDIIAGNKNTIIVVGIPKDIIRDLSLSTGHSEEFIQEFMKINPEKVNDFRSISNYFLLLDALKKSNLQRSNIVHSYQNDGNILSANPMESIEETIKYRSKAAATYVNDLEFNKAHQLLGDALKIIEVTHVEYPAIYKEYLITGFIWHSRENNIEGLKSLLHNGAAIEGDKKVEIEYLFSLIFQEIFTRDINVKGLEEITASLENTYTNASDLIKPAMANSFGLANRRLGERRGIFFLNKAITIFNEGLACNTDKIMEVELKDQMAITHIRIFELTHDKHELSLAEELLVQCLKLLQGPLSPKNYRLKPRVLNNYGNVFKQRFLIFNEISCAGQAIKCYEEAEKYWNEKNANYDWALLRKNIAETKYALGKITRDEAKLLESILDSISSIKYRTFENSPYQWAKSVDIIFSAIIFLDQMKSIKSIPEDVRKIIISYVDLICEDENIWKDNLSDSFIEKAKLTQNVLELPHK